MLAKLGPGQRLALQKKQQKVRIALQDVRRIAASARRAFFMLPRIEVETAGAASVEWEMPVVPSQHDVVRGVRLFPL